MGCKGIKNLMVCVCGGGDWWGVIKIEVWAGGGAIDSGVQSYLIY